MSEESIATPAEGKQDPLPMGSQAQINSISDLIRGETQDEENTDQPAEGPASGEGEATSPREGATNEATETSEEAGGSQELTVPTSLDELVEATGLSAEEFYALKIPMGDDGEPLSVGEVKDLAKDVRRAEQAREQLDEQRTQFENEMIRSRQELQQVLALLGPDKLTPELLAAARQALDAQLDQDREALAQMKPEWKDPATFQRAQDEMVEFVSEYGFGRGDLAMIIDHRLTKLIYDATKLKQRVTRADANAKEVRTKLKRIRKAGQDTGKTKPKSTAPSASSKRAKQEAAVSQLVQGALNDE